MTTPGTRADHESTTARATEDPLAEIAYGEKSTETTTPGADITVRLGATDLQDPEIARGDKTSNSNTAATQAFTNDDQLSKAATPYTSPLALNALADIAAKLDIQIPTPEPDTTTPSTASTGTAGNSSSKSTGASSRAPPAQCAAAKKVVKMRPGPVRNGRNLCTHRWLKQFKDTTNGTTAEFKVYYDLLTKEQREAYDKEATELVARDAWNKDAFESPML